MCEPITKSPQRPAGKNDTLWWDKIRRGDYVAFESLFRTYSGDLYRYLFQIVRTKTVAEELVQDLFVSLWSHRSRLSINQSVRSYLFVAARHRAIDHLRHQKLVRSRIEREGAQHHIRIERDKTIDPEGDLCCQELDERFRQTLESLPHRRREIYELSRASGLTYQEIAEVLGISVKTVETQMNRAFSALRYHLREYLKQ